MQTFYEWLACLRLDETYYGLDPAEYNRFFDAELEKVIAKTRDPAHREALEKMRRIRLDGLHRRCGAGGGLS